jgi:hypothetical protein
MGGDVVRKMEEEDYDKVRATTAPMSDSQLPMLRALMLLSRLCLLRPGKSTGGTLQFSR